MSQAPTNHAAIADGAMNRGDFERLVRLEEASAHTREILQGHRGEAKAEMQEIRYGLNQVTDKVAQLGDQVKQLADLSAQRLVQLEAMSKSLGKVEETLSSAKAGWRTLVYAGSAVTTLVTCVATAAWWLAGKLGIVLTVAPPR